LLSNQLVENAGKSTLSVVDSRTGKKYEISISNNFIKASELEKIKDDSGSIIRSYDPGYMNTVNCVII
jgi:citrate synthase